MRILHLENDDNDNDNDDDDDKVHDREAVQTEENTIIVLIGYSVTGRTPNGKRMVPMLGRTSRLRETAGASIENREKARKLRSMILESWSNLSSC